MKKLNQLIALTSACVLAMSATQLCAQEEGQGRGRRGGGGGGGGGGFGGDPAQFQQQRMERLKEQLEVKDDAEWKAMEPLVTKVMDAQREVTSLRMRGGGGRGGGGGGGGFGGGGGGGAEPSPEATALQTAIESKASNADIKAALTKYRDARKAKEAALTKAQDDLRKVVSVRQEAILVTSNILN